MQELEKILEEIEQREEYLREMRNVKKKEGINIDLTVGYRLDEIKEIKQIILKHLNDDWIPVDDRDHMPDAGEHVLVSIGTGFNPEKAFLSEDGRWMMLHAPAGYNDITDEVEAWMPMPKPYHSESVRLRNERNTF